MADYTSVNPNSGLGGVDTRQLMRQAQNDSNSDVVGNAGFEKALGVAGDVMSFASPMLAAGSKSLGFRGAAITSAAVSAFSGQGGSLSMPGIGGTGTSATIKGLAMPGQAPGYPGAGGTTGIPGAAPGFPGTGAPAGGAGGADLSSADAQINSMMTNNLAFFSIQQKAQNVAQISNLMSNIAKTDSDAKLNAIRNVKA